MSTPASWSCCPHLGLNRDRTIMLMSPTMAHRCYVQAEPLLPDPERQAHFCLVANHSQCPLYTPMTERLLAPTSSGAGSRQKLPLLATTTLPAPTTQLVRVQQPARPPNANRILLPRKQQAALVRQRAKQALLLPVVSSYSARRLHRWSFWSTKVTMAATILLVFLSLASGYVIRRQQQATARTYQPSNVVVMAVNPSPTVTQTPLAAAVAVVNAAVNTTPTAAALGTLERFVTPTPPPGGQSYYLTPGNNSVGWWMSNDERRNHVNDSFLYVGQNQGEAHIAAMRFDLRNIPRGAAIVHGELRLTGVRADNLVTNTPATWQLQLIAEEALPNLASADFLSLLSAPASLSLLPAINEQALAADAVNTWTFDSEVNAWLQEQLLLGATSLTLRLTANTNGQDTLFAWDSGVGAATTERGPALVLSVGPAPVTPPALPTKPFIVATLTPPPANVLTVVAANSTATAMAVTTGTYTPVPYQVVTPTPFPANLSTVQAVALDRGLPPVLPETPTPANPAEATGNAQYATAVAVTTGTFTPVPTGFVTPVLVMPSPPVENVATAAARSLEATAVAANGVDTPTALPYNAVIADYVYATAVPENAATADAQAIIATAAALVDGTPTPLAWNVIVITQVPTPLPPVAPSPTPLPSLQPITDFTPTPTPTVYLVPAVMPDIYRHKIVFKTNRSGQEETYALDPNSGELFRVNEPWVHELAYRQLAVSPDGQEQAIVQADANRVLQIHVHSLQYGLMRQISTFKGMSYDPAWSPLGGQIAFVSTDSGSDEIYLVTVDGSIIQQLTNNNNQWDKHPSWSPDGTQIVFFSNRDVGRRQLWLMNADGSGQHNLSNNSYEDWDPIWVR